MSVVDWTALITQVGFPIVVALLVGKWAAQRVEKAEERSVDREKSQNQRIAILETEIKDELKVMVVGYRDLVVENTAVNRECVMALKDCTAVLSRLKKSSPHLDVPSGSDVIIRHRDGTEEQRSVHE